MTFGDPGGGDNIRNHLRLDASSGQDADPAGCMVHQAANDVQSLRHRGPASTGKHPGNAEADQGFQGCLQIRGDVECPVKSYQHSCCGCQKRLRQSPVDPPIRCEPAKDHAVCPTLPRRPDIFPHDFCFRFTIKKVPAARTDHHHDLTRKNPPGDPEESGGGCGASFHQTSTKLDPVCTTLSASLHGGLGVYTNFDSHEE